MDDDLNTSGALSILFELSQPIKKFINSLKEKGVNIHKWSDEILDALEAAWMEVVEEESNNDADFKRSWESLSLFRKEIEVWKSLGYLDN